MNTPSKHGRIVRNKVDTYIVISLFIVFITTLFYLLGKVGDQGVIGGSIGFMFALFASYISFFYADRIILALSGARRLKNEENEPILALVASLCQEYGIFPPSVYATTDPSINAFATGKCMGSASVCITSGALQVLNRAQLEGLLSHELSHIAQYDTRFMSIVALLIGWPTLVSDYLLYVKHSSLFLRFCGYILLPLAFITSPVMHMSLSQKRELLADASGTLVTRYPEGLVSLLEKIQTDTHSVSRATNATAHLYFVNPFGKTTHAPFFAGLFHTHPPLEERIKLLRSM